MQLNAAAALDINCGEIRSLRFWIPAHLHNTSGNRLKHWTMYSNKLFTVQNVQNRLAVHSTLDWNLRCMGCSWKCICVDDSNDENCIAQMQGRMFLRGVFNFNQLLSHQRRRRCWSRRGWLWSSSPVDKRQEIGPQQISEFSCLSQCGLFSFFWFFKFPYLVASFQIFTANNS